MDLNKSGEKFNFKEYKFIFIMCIISLFYNFNSIVNLLIVLTIMYLVSVASLNKSILIYLAFTLWENVFPLKIGSLGLLIELVIVFKIIIIFLKQGYVKKIKVRYIVLFIFISVYACADLLYYKSISGIGVMLDILIVIQISYIIEEKYSMFWNDVFNIYIISCFFACIYGLLHKAFLPRWIAGIGEVVQFYGTIGTSRMAMFINIAILFTLSGNYSKRNKVLLLIFFYVMLFSTVSMAGIAVNIVIILLYYLNDILQSISVCFKRRSINKTLLKVTFTILILVGITMSIVSIREKIPVFNNILTRVENVLKDFSEGDIYSATSGRDSIGDVYINEFEKLEPINKIIGTGSIIPVRYVQSKIGYDKYSHNTFIDMLFWGGYLSIVLFIMYLMINLWGQRKKKYFKKIFLMKLILLTNALNVSILNAVYFYIWILI